MGYLDAYITRLNANGSNSSDGIIQASKRTVGNSFDNSLFSSTVLIDNVDYEVIVTQEKQSEDKKILLKPDTKVNIGAVVKMNELNYLVIDFLGDGINEIYPTATLKVCNESLLLSGEPEETQVGIDPNTGQPVFDYTDGLPISYPCIVTMTMGNENLKNQPININGDTILVTLPYFDFKESQIELYDETYQVKSIDKTKVINGVGLLTILGEKV